MSAPGRNGHTWNWLSLKFQRDLIIIVTKACFWQQPKNSYDDEELVSETFLSSDCEMKADAASGNPIKISTNTDSQSQNSCKRKMAEFSCNPGMQKH